MARDRHLGAFALLCSSAYGTYAVRQVAAGTDFQFAGVVVIWARIGGNCFSAVGKGNWIRVDTRRLVPHRTNALLCIYIGLAAAAHHKALEDVRRVCRRSAFAAGLCGRAAVTTDTCTHWAGLITHAGRRVAYHVPRTERRGGQRGIFPRARRSRDLVEVARKLRDVQIYLWFARFPVWRVVPLGGNETAVEISDVRFFREGNRIRGRESARGRRHRADADEAVQDSRFKWCSTRTAAWCPTDSRSPSSRVRTMRQECFRDSSLALFGS